MSSAAEQESTFGRAFIVRYTFSDPKVRHLGRVSYEQLNTRVASDPNPDIQASANVFTAPRGDPNPETNFAIRLVGPLDIIDKDYSVLFATAHLLSWLGDMGCGEARFSHANVSTGIIDVTNPGGYHEADMAHIPVTDQAHRVARALHVFGLTARDLTW